MRRTATLALPLITALACAGAPRIQQTVGADRVFSPQDRFAPASASVLGAENPTFDEPELDNLEDLIGKAIGWRGLTMAPEKDADWWVSCAFRKRLIWIGDITREPITEPWRPSRPRVLGTERTEYDPRGTVDPNVPQVAPWVETIIELRLRSRRTGTIGWSVERVWGRDRTELPEDDLKATLDLLLGQIPFTGKPPPAAGPR